MLPGCSKDCYKEGDRVHDYCGHTHYEEHLSQLQLLGKRGEGGGIIIMMVEGCIP
jgi:hypothetical protein